MFAPGVRDPKILPALAPVQLGICPGNPCIDKNPISANAIASLE